MDWPSFLAGIGSGVVAGVVGLAFVVRATCLRTARDIERIIRQRYDSGDPCPCQRCNATPDEALHAWLPPCPRTIPQ